jgi:predicted transcriptional regulator of viral defense system
MNKRIYGETSLVYRRLLAHFAKKGMDWFSVAHVRAFMPELAEYKLREYMRGMVAAELVVCIRKGTYCIVPTGQDFKTFSPDWRMLAEPITKQEHYIAFRSALQIHQQNMQAPPAVQLVLQNQIDFFGTVLEYAPFQVIRFDKTHFFGYEKTWLNSSKYVFCSDLEKTLIDCLYKTKYAGGVLGIAKAIYTLKDKIDCEKLLEYATLFASNVVIKRLGYLLETLKINTRIIEVLREMCLPSSISLLDPDYPAYGAILTRWNIRKNVDVDIEAIMNYWQV